MGTRPSPVWAQQTARLLPPRGPWASRVLVCPPLKPPDVVGRRIRSLNPWMLRNTMPPAVRSVLRGRSPADARGTCSSCRHLSSEAGQRLAGRSRRNLPRPPNKIGRRAAEEEAQSPRTRADQRGPTGVAGRKQSACSCAATSGVEDAPKPTSAGMAGENPGGPRRRGAVPRSAPTFVPCWQLGRFFSLTRSFFTGVGGSSSFPPICQYLQTFWLSPPA